MHIDTHTTHTDAHTVSHFTPASHRGVCSAVLSLCVTLSLHMEAQSGLIISGLFIHFAFELRCSFYSPALAYSHICTHRCKNTPHSYINNLIRAVEEEITPKHNDTDASLSIKIIMLICSVRMNWNFSRISTCPLIPCLSLDSFCTLCLSNEVAAYRLLTL